MFKLLLFVCMLVVAAAEPKANPGVFYSAYAAPVAAVYPAAAYATPVSAAYTSRAAAYTAPVAAAYTDPLYSAYTAPVAAYSAYTYSLPFYPFRR